MTTDEGVHATSWPAVPTAGGVADRLISPLRALRAGLDEVRSGLPLRGSEDAAAVASGLADQIDDYLLPRLSHPGTPPVLVIGGSTGGGKSTLLNTLVGAPISPAGVLRPTTRSAVLVCHPDDHATFVSGGPVPGLPRTADGAPGTVRVRSTEAVPPGLALVDAPDVDSVVAENRQLAVRLLGAADLWIFVTTAARYADAVPWDLLRGAVARGAAVAIVLSRVNHLAHATVSTHLREMLRAEGLGAAPLFVIEQVALEEHGLLPEQAVRSLRMWTGRISASEEQRTTIVRQTLTGAIAAVRDRVDTVADATKAQQGAVTTLRGQIGQAYAAAEARLRASVEDGVLFRGDVVGRWQEYAGNGGLAAILDARSGSKSGVLSGQASIRAARIRAGLVGGVVRLFTSVADEAAAELVAAWRTNPGGAAAAEAVTERASAEAAKKAEDATRAWLDGVDASIARADGSMRAGVVPVVVSAALQDGTLPVGREVDVAGGTVTLSAELLAEVFEDEGVRAAGRTARADLLDRLATALASEQHRFAARLDELDPPIGLADRLRDAARAIDRNRSVVDQLFADPSTLDLRPNPSPAARDLSELPSTETLQAVAAALRPSTTFDLRPAPDDTASDSSDATSSEASAEMTENPAEPVDRAPAVPTAANVDPDDTPEPDDSPKGS
ncbi:ABC transporter [Cryptosporangium arvum]|uniref:ABC transporter n=1 Tax=Cryptosporangium arvum TaxID=80871 RepID=UPI001470593A|nr:ABC transporter [Cryptosporangium arvum]